ncbi:PaaX family transcriptional regulator C-terminal domain-containing protein, partial [Streptomyces albidoflavus]
WTLLTFSLPEDQRTLRSRLRAILGWEGFVPIRDGLWLAPGTRDLSAALAPLREELPTGSVLAFEARELDGFSVGERVLSAWDVDGIRRAHEGFIDRWNGASPYSGSPLSMRVVLVADWLDLLRTDPGLPHRFMGKDWPAERSVALYRELRARTESPALREFQEHLARTDSS